MFCTNCGKEISNDSKFCEYCGGKINIEKKNGDIIRYCPFCKKEINIDDEICSYCSRVLIEKISQDRINTGSKPDDSIFNNLEKENIISKIIKFSKQINYPKFIFLAFLGMIFLAWIFSEDNSPSVYNNENAKIPLPPPVTQISSDAVEFTPNTLSNGTVLKKNNAYLQGYGELKIINGANLDAVAKLIYGGTSVLTVYIKANSTYTMLDVSDGIYWLVFAQGLDWDPTKKSFKSDTQYSVFEDTFNFVTIEHADAYEYQTFEVTLNPVIGGTAETDDILGSEFDQY
jgi:predicted nucleic acid-binding Zn ribbon protein